MWVDLGLTFFAALFGSTIRYLIEIGVTYFYKGEYSIYLEIANFLGCMVSGMLFNFSNCKGYKKMLHSAIGIGFCGSLTTFSTYINHTLTIFETGFELISIAEVISHLIGCYIFFGIGLEMSCTIAWFFNEEESEEIGA